MARVIGREAELRTVEGFLDAVSNRADEAHAGVLLIRGDAGIGKTTLWEAAVELARERRVQLLATRAAAAEADLTLTTLGDLVEQVPQELIDPLPDPQRRALDAALLNSDLDAGPMQPRLLGAAIRTIVAGLAARGPVVLAIDDVQWADPASAVAIAYAVRRLQDRPLAVVLAQRTGTPSRFDLASLVPAERVWAMEVGPLSVAALHHVLKERTGASPARATLIRIHEASGGSPLFALEIARLLDATGVPPPGQPLPVPPDVRALLRERVAALPPATREMLLHAAVLGRAPVDLLERALDRSIAADAEASAREDVARIEGGQVAFRHPLLAGAVSADATPAARRAAHRRLAEVVDGTEERARHRALAADGPDPAVADELASAARVALARAAPGAAADLLRLAIELTPPADTAARFDLAVERAGYLKRAGDSDAAVQELEEVIAGAPAGPARARARLALAAIRYETDASGVAVELATGAIEDAEDDPELLARAHAVLAAVDWEDFRRRTLHAAEAYRLLQTLADPDPEVVSVVLMQQIAVETDNGRPLDFDLVERALDAERRAPAINVADRVSATVGPMLKYQDRLDEARTWLDRVHQAALDEGDEGSLPYALSHLPELELWAGNWQAAETAARQHLELSTELSLESQRRQALYNLALVLAHRGAFEEARALAEEARELALADGDAWTASGVEPVLGLIELSSGDLATAADLLGRASATRDEIGIATPRRPDGDLIEALVGLGRLDAARTLSSAMEARARGANRTSSLAIAARARGLVAAASGDADGAIAALDEALALHDLAPFPYDRARTLLALGQVQRRRRERRAAKAALDEALSIFERLPAPAWAERARHELDRVGLRRSSAELTETERRVADLAASGLTNREVASTLFISPKTVEANLARVYGKLGVRSRAQLVRAMGDPTTGEAAAPQT